MMLQSFFGLGIFLLLAWLVSENRWKVSPKGVLLGVAVQLILGNPLPEDTGLRTDLPGLEQRDPVSGRIHPGRHRLCVRLPGRRDTAIRGKVPHL